MATEIVSQCQANTSSQHESELLRMSFVTLFELNLYDLLCSAVELLSKTDDQNC